MQPAPDPRDVALGLAAGGARAGLAAGRAALLPARLAVRAPVLGGAVRRAAGDLAHEGMLLRARTSVRFEELTEQVLRSPEMDRVVEYIATSPKVVEAVSQQTQTLAGEMVSDVRERTHKVDDVAERTVRGWLRRPRPSPA